MHPAWSALPMLPRQSAADLRAHSAGTLGIERGTLYPNARMLNVAVACKDCSDVPHGAAHTVRPNHIEQKNQRCIKAAAVHGNCTRQTQSGEAHNATVAGASEPPPCRAPASRCCWEAATSADEVLRFFLRKEDCRVPCRVNLEEWDPPVRTPSS